MEQEAREAGSVTRGQNALYVMPHDWASIAQFLEPVIGKIDASVRDVQLLVITPDAESAAAIGAAAVKLASRETQIIAATSAQRAARLMKLRPAHIVTGSAPTIVQLLRSASLKLDTLRVVCLAWADELITRGDSSALETVMTDVPKEASRTIVASDLTPEVDELVERYARRARKVFAAPNETDAPVAIDYLTVSQPNRAATLRRVLDAIDPLSALVFVREGESRTVVEDLLNSIGYAGATDITIGLASSPGTALTVLYDLPATREELREAASGSARTIALAQPRQIPSLRALAAGGALRPFTLPEAKHDAHAKDTRARNEIRALLDEGHFGRELLALEPLLESYDGIEIAAAALQLLERERRLREVAEASAGATRREPSEMVKLFITVGARDGARASDLVGAIANQGGVSSAEVGKVDVRESHSIVEVSANTADAIIERVNGTTIKGRRAVVRRDENAELRPSRPTRDRSDRGDRGDRAPRGDRGDRGPRSDRGERSDRGPRGPRSDRGDRGERGGGRFERGDRAPRGDRPPRSDRPPPRRDREDRDA